MAKYLGETGLVYLWGKIKAYVQGVITNLNLSGTYVAKEAGKGLSTNDYTTAEKNKLSGIAAGAEVNVQSNWSESDSTSDAYIKNKPSIPTKTTDLTNDSGFITIADVPEGAAASTTTPKMDGTAAVGTETAFARGDHRHPSDTSKQNVINDLEDIREGASAGATAYQKPSGGIPKTDLASAVQNSLGLADSALQSSDITGKADKSATVSTVAYDATNKKITKTINGSTTDVVTAAKIVEDGGGVTDVSGKVDKTTTVNGHALSGNVTVTKSDVSLGNVTNDAQVKRTEMGVANGVATLDTNGKVPSSQLPSYVDDVVEAYIRSGQTALSQNWLATGSATGTVITPESGKIYVLMNGDDSYPTNTQFRWGGSAYVKLNDGGIAEMTTTEMDTATNNWA